MRQNVQQTGRGVLKMDNDWRGQRFLRAKHSVKEKTKRPGGFISR
jgi:hypothetical protein